MERFTGVVWLAICCVVAVGCGSGATPGRNSSSGQVGEESPSPSEVVSTLDGVWVERFTCQEFLDVLKRLNAEEHASEAIGGMESGPPPPKNDPCRGAPAAFERTYTFSGNHLVGYTDAEGIGLDVIVRLTDGGFVIPGDPGDPDYEFQYTIDGDRMTVRAVHQDEWGFRAAWEAAPLERQS